MISSNIHITQYIGNDFVVDYEKREEKCQLNYRRSAESLPEIENVSALFQDTNILELDQ